MGASGTTARILAGSAGRSDDETLEAHSSRPPTTRPLVLVCERESPGPRAVTPFAEWPARAAEASVSRPVTELVVRAGVACGLKRKGGPCRPPAEVLPLTMELGGLEPPTSWVRSRRSPS